MPPPTGSERGLREARSGVGARDPSEKPRAPPEAPDFAGAVAALGRPLRAPPRRGGPSGAAPQVDVGSPPGVPDARGKLGPAIGASGTSAFDDSAEQGRPIGGRPGPSASRAPITAARTGRVGMQEGPANFRPKVLEPVDLPRYGDIEVPPASEVGLVGEEGGVSLDEAIGVLIRQNINLMALRFEIPMAEADVLTAGLRANPIFYADSQLIPYGHYSSARPGGQTQYDVNITYPLDVTFKRRARVEVARQAKRVTEAQFQDAVRLSVDNLYTAFVDVAAADQNLKYSRTYLEGVTRLLRLNEKLLGGGRIIQAKVDALRSQVEQAQLQVRESEEALITSRRNLALLLSVPRQQADALRVRDNLRDVRALPEESETFVGWALAGRPDLAAYRFGLTRARADVKLAEANRYSDVYLLAQPYTFQDNRPQGLKSAYSYAIGVTANVPIYNRNQGNIRRSSLNARQSQVELEAQQRQVAHEVEAAVREFELSRTSVIEIEREVLPAARRVQETALNRFQSGESSPEDYLEAQREFNERARQYRDALVRHRRAMLDLNTAVGRRVLP